MQKTTDKSQDTKYQERLECCQIVQYAIESGIWGQIHGTVTHNEPLLKSLRANQESEK
ncbi:hypothetical protein IKJ53_07340 [bacterium]|nr:hypothetical protein [bacterium]